MKLIDQMGLNWLNNFEKLLEIKIAYNLRKFNTVKFIPHKLDSMIARISRDQKLPKILISKLETP